MSKIELDLELLRNNPLFQKIKEQSNLFEELFNELANEFPQKILLKFHGNSKGTKISKGFNLENSPYQVLDLVRDFDDLSGFNIRILNWWGHGLYIFVYLGSGTSEKHPELISKLSSDYRDCEHPSPWAYGEILGILANSHNFDLESDSAKLNFKQFFKQVDPFSDFKKTLEALKKEIRFVLDYHY
jgi:hypothetical protein